MTVDAREETEVVQRGILMLIHSWHFLRAAHALHIVLRPVALLAFNGTS